MLCLTHPTTGMGLKPKHLPDNQVIKNVGLKDIPEMEVSEVKAAVKQIKHRKASGENQITAEMLKTNEENLERSLFILFKNVC